ARLDRRDPCLLILWVEAAAPVPRRDDRRGPVLVEEERDELVLTQPGVKDELVAMPSSTGVRVGLARHKTQNAESFEVAGDRGGSATAQLDDAHPATSWPSARALARQSATRTTASRNASRKGP